MRPINADSIRKRVEYYFDDPRIIQPMQEMIDEEETIEPQRIPIDFIEEFMSHQDSSDKEAIRMLLRAWEVACEE